ncbi:HhH-GPD-type base excision DNA repair protein [Kitasatospora albolonga]|uniref:HhH-GPD-type base excision DNA repair protein n=1 Tax=Kitasatospora albolonga TaxID=68173 RepID=UPI0031ED5CCF
MAVAVRLAQRPAADELLGRSPLAALVGVLLDERVPLDWAFTAPLLIARRLGTDGLDVRRIAACDPGRFASLCRADPAVHSQPAAMARKVQHLCKALVARYDGEVTGLWAGARSGAEVYDRLLALPGFGPQKSRVFVALLGKRYGIRPEGWREAAGVYGEDGVRLSAADVTGPESLAAVIAARSAMRDGARRARAAATAR